MKKQIAIMLCLALLLSIVPVLALPETASAAPATSVNINGGAAIPSYSGANGAYTFANGVLTLTDFKDTNAIAWTTGELEIVVNGECEVSGIGGGSSTGELTISGSGTLTVINPSGNAIDLVNDLVVDGEDGVEVKAITTAANSVGIYINGGNLNVESNGMLEGTGNGNDGIWVKSSTDGDGKGNITVNGGTLKGSGEGGIRSNGGDITLIIGSITGTANDSLPGILTMPQNAIGGKITVKGGTLTGTSTYTTASGYANGIRADYGMEITGGVVLGENENPNAEAVQVTGAQLTMSGGKLTGTNSGIGANYAHGILASEGITMTGNASNTPEMIGSGPMYGINVGSSDIVLTKATMTGAGTQYGGIYCENLEMVDSTVSATSAGTVALSCLSLDVSGTSYISATGKTAGILARDTFKVRGNPLISATATGRDVGGQVVESFGVGIAMIGANSFDVDLDSGMIIAKGVKGYWMNLSINSNLNSGAGIEFDVNAATVSLGKNTFVEDGQTLVDGDPAFDYFKQAYGKNGVVAEETVFYYKADDVILSGLPTSVRVGVPFTLSPSITGGTWYFEEEYFSRDGNTFTPLKTGATVITYMLQDERTARLEVEILAREENPQTGDNANVGLWLCLMLGVSAIAAGAWRKKNHA
ncbi:carbohydrate-binding domain-containing protein [Eubacteriales bacterium OttesenSCG-928-M02]|nr:carbohydrate-binding domain-containing protein [Eubacteriales bacterium OttesenSCG-928-M02]